MPTTSHPVVWLDFENAPHAWVLAPIAARFKQGGYHVLATARDFSQTVPLCRYLGLDPEVIGPSKSTPHRRGKVVQTLLRAARLWFRIRRQASAVLAVSHGSRAQVVASWLARVPAVTLDDYEYSFQGFNQFAKRLLVPSVIPRTAWAEDAARVVHYPGLKEELYLWQDRPASRGSEGLPIDPRSLLVLLRPGSESAHYRSAATDDVQAALLARLSRCGKVSIVLVPRDRLQGERLARQCAALGMPVWTPPKVLDGPALIGRMDLVLGGGGTMTREAAVLGVPAYSFFGGTWGAVDCHLEAQGRLVRLAVAADAERVRLCKRTTPLVRVSSRTLDTAVNWLFDFAAKTPQACAARDLQ